MLTRRVRRVLLAACGLLACAEPDWARQVWPTDDPRAPAQPSAYAESIDLQLRARTITWEPSGLVVALELEEAAGSVTCEPQLIFLQYDGLEYAPQWLGDPPGARTLGPGERVEFVLRYDLGRALTGPDAKLELRGLLIGDRPIVEIPELAIPPMPAEDRPR